MRDTNRKAKSTALLDAALALFLTQGIEAVSIDDITKSAKMAKGSFYRYFSDQRALVAALIDPVRQRMEELLTQCLEDTRKASTREAMFGAYQKIGNEMSAFLLEHTGVTRLYLQEGRAPAEGPRQPVVAMAQAISRKAIEITEVAQSHGILKPIPPAVSGLAVVGAVERMLLAVLWDEVKDPLDVPGQLTTLILDGLKA